jgi:hypothetical protein
MRVGRYFFSGDHEHRYNIDDKQTEFEDVMRFDEVCKCFTKLQIKGES